MSPQALPQTVVTARRRFREGVIVPGDLVPPAILRSWTRCRERGLEMGARPRVEPMSSSELRALCERNETLRRLCRPELEALHAEARATDSVVILTDGSGLILDRLGSAGFAERAAEVALRPGVAWAEGATGTNAIGTALMERRPVEVRGAEHYFEPHRILSCSASPILDPRGELVGVLDLSGHAAVHHLHALGMVRLAVDQIEHRFFAQAFAGRELLRLHTDPALLGTPREGILVFEDQRLVAANRHALALIGLGWEDLGERQFGELFEGALGRLDEQCRLRSREGRDLQGRLERSRPSLPPARPPAARSQASARKVEAPFFAEATAAALARAVRLLDADVPVLIRGETGTGKEVFAREVHARSARAAKPFVAVNCAALPETLIESELFGYEEGAFTGARRRGSKGYLREAEGGVLFLDEIGDMPLALQGRLLRVLQEREVTPLGGGRAVAVDFALICASHRNLRELVTDGRFRADLFFRVAQYTVELPALRTVDDRDALIRTLWQQVGASEAALAPESQRLLAAYEWPGNFRQLVATLRALAVLAEPGQAISPEMLPAEVRESRSAVAAQPPVLLSAIARDAMRSALAGSDGNVAQAARRLGVSRSTLYRRLLSNAASVT